MSYSFSILFSIHSLGAAAAAGRVAVQVRGVHGVGAAPAGRAGGASAELLFYDVLLREYRWPRNFRVDELPLHAGRLRLATREKALHIWSVFVAHERDAPAIAKEEPVPVAL